MRQRPVQGQNHDSDVSLSMCVPKGGRVPAGFPSLETERKGSSYSPTLSIPEHCHNKQLNSQRDEY